MDLVYKAEQHFSSNNKTISFNRFKKNQSKNVSKMLVSKTGFGQQKFLKINYIFRHNKKKFRFKLMSKLSIKMSHLYR